MIGLLDCNNFFVSCERVFRPDLARRPVVVLSNNDGCVIARSNEVKALGVPMGAPYFQVKDLLNAHNVIVFSSNFQLYADFSARVMALVAAYFPRLEVYSIDEVFIDFTGFSDLRVRAQALQRHIQQVLGIPASIGIATTKTLAKVANHLAKKDPSYQNVCFLDSEEVVDTALQTLRVQDLWGIGPRMAKRLAELGIFTAYQLKQQNSKWIRRLFTVMGERWVHELNGVSCLTLETAEKPRQSIQVTRSFAIRLKTYQELEPILASHATRLARRLRRQDLKTQNIWVCLRTRTQEPQRFSTIVTLPMAAQDDTNLIRATLKGLRQIFKPGFFYDKAGIMGLDLVPAHHSQGDFFHAEAAASPKQQNLMNAMDQLNHKYGSGTIFMAVCGQQWRWPDRKEYRSPRYTTDWHELARVR